MWYKHFHLSQLRQVSLKKNKLCLLNLLVCKFLCSVLDLLCSHNYWIKLKMWQQPQKKFGCLNKIISLILCLLMGNNSSHLSWINCWIPKILPQNIHFSIILCNNNIKELVLNRLYMSKYMWMLLFQELEYRLEEYVIIHSIKLLKLPIKETSSS